MTIKRLLATSAKGLLIYIGINVIWGLLHYMFHTTKFSTSQEIPGLWDCIYFSFVTSGTIGYGDIFSQSVLGQLVIILQSLTSILFVGIFGGYVAYQFLKRPENIILSEFVYLRLEGKNILFALRIGNKGKELINAKLEIAVTQIRNDLKRTFYKKEFNYSLLERTWHPTVNLSESGNADFLDALKIFYHDSENTMIRILLSGSDIDTGEYFGVFRYYEFAKLKISGKFHDVYNWKSLKRTVPNWKNFDKTNDISEADKDIVMDFMK